MKIFLDDERKQPDDKWTIAKSAEEAINLLKTNNVHKISLDHDLGRKKTGYDVLLWIEKEARKGNKNMRETWNKVYEIASKVASTGYLVLPVAGKSINVKAGNVVMVWELDHTLEEGMTYELLEQFYQEEYGPAYMKNFPGSQFCVFKGERGERIGKYTELIVINSMEEFDKWNTEDGKKTKQAFKNMGEIQERMERIDRKSVV